MHQIQIMSLCCVDKGGFVSSGIFKSTIICLHGSENHVILPSSQRWPRFFQRFDICNYTVSCTMGIHINYVILPEDLVIKFRYAISSSVIA